MKFCSRFIPGGEEIARHTLYMLCYLPAHLLLSLKRDELEPVAEWMRRKKGGEDIGGKSQLALEGRSWRKI